MGNLGWDTEAAELETRARHVLVEANVGVEGLPLHAAVGRNGKGSSVEILFGDADALHEARFKVRQVRRSFTTGRLVWLDVQKTSEQHAPA